MNTACFGGALLNIKDTVKEVVSAVLPITALVILLQFTAANTPPETFIKFIGGSIMVMIGFILFLIGVQEGFLPLGELIGSAIATKGKLWFLLVFGFITGFAVTVADPDVQILAIQVGGVSEGAIDKKVLILFVAIGIGIFTAIALLRIFLKIPMKYILLVGYSIAFLLAFFTPPEFLAVSFDAGGVATGPMIVSFILALGIGISSVAGTQEESGGNFGILGLGVIGPILALLLLGVFYR
jgi:hypothetical protein